MSVNDFLLDFAVASVFIMIGQFLRAKVGFIQRFFIPASMLAGFMGLAFRYVFPGISAHVRFHRLLSRYADYGHLCCRSASTASR